MYYEQLRDQLYATVPYPDPLSRMISGNMSTWMKFCGLPKPIKDAFIRPESNGMDEGYFRRHKSAGREDKEYFHFSAASPEWVGEAKVPYSDESWVQASQHATVSHFLDFAGMLHEALSGFAAELAGDFERFLPGIAAEVTRPGARRVIRFLHYDPQDPNDEILAAQHFDRGGFTLHLYESHPGLQYLGLDGKTWKPAPIHQGLTVAFTGYQLEQYSEGAVQKTWHRVVRDPSLLGQGHRYSAVMFMDLPAQFAWPDHLKRTQDEVPGYLRVTQG